MIPSSDLLLRHTRPGPRYTSYPPAPQWSSDFPDEARIEALRGVSRPASVYVHVPFCADRCTYCALHMVPTTRRDLGTRYLDALERHIGRLPFDGLPVARIHLGGGTPTWLAPAELERLFGMLRSRFSAVEGAEISVEADPEITTDEQVDVLAALGVNRLSLGVQSFDPRVLEAVCRPQRVDRVAELLDRARGHGMWGLNLDLMYGLPFQDTASLEGTLDEVLRMRPDRLAVFGYAHVPWAMPHQRRLPAEALPGPVERMDLFLRAHQVLTDAGYEAIGLDHFALPDDELAVAARERRLHRNFMGYTTRSELDLVGLGMSAISEIGDTYVQETSRLGRWWTAVEEGGPLVEKGCHLDLDDRIRKDVIDRVMCNFTVPWADVSRRWGVDATRWLRTAIASLQPLEADGLVEVHADRVDVTPLGRWLVRNVAMAFDRYLTAPKAQQEPRYSSTV